MATQPDIPAWRLVGNWWDLCNCAIGCPCNFGSDPTLGYCEGVLTWLRFDTYGALAWQDGEHIGLRFDRLVPLRYLVETRQCAPSVVRDEAMGDELAAKQWIYGSR